MEIQNWQPVKNFEGLYEINEKSVVRSLHKRNYHSIITQRIDRAGYYTVRLNKAGKDSTQFVHRLLGFAFLAEPTYPKAVINHKDGNKLNNSLDNLEWTTQSGNMKHAYISGLSKVPDKNYKKVVDTCTNMVYKSVREAATALDITYSTCKNYLNGNRPNPTCLRYAV